MFTHPTLLALYAEARYGADLHPRPSAPRRVRALSRDKAIARQTMPRNPAVAAGHSRP